VLEEDSTLESGVRVMSVKDFSDSIGNRTSDLSACSAMPLPTAPPRAPNDDDDCDDDDDDDKLLSSIREFHFRNSFALYFGIILVSSCSSSRC
jgi:hypothetical protein